MRVNQKPASATVGKMTAPEKEFALKLYRWALEDARRESSEGFPLLRGIRSKMVDDYLEFVDALSPGEKRILEVSMVKRFHGEGAFLAGDELTAKENIMIERYLKRNITEDQQYGSVSLLSHAEGKWAKELASGSNRYQVNRQSLRAVLKERLASTLGGSIEISRRQVEWRYSTPVGKWIVYTWVDTGGRLFQLSYHHTVSLRPHVNLTEHMSILRWLGIAGQTNWDLLTNADIPGVAESVAALSSHFIDAMSRIQQGS